jgi:hypothetical protein
MEYYGTILPSGNYHLRAHNGETSEGLSLTIKKALLAILPKEESGSLAGAGSGSAKRVGFSEKRTTVIYQPNVESYTVSKLEGEEPVVVMLRKISEFIALPETVHCAHTIREDLPEEATLFFAKIDPLESALKGIKRTGRNDELARMVEKNYQEVQALSLVLEDGKTTIITHIDQLPPILVLIQNFEADIEVLHQLGRIHMDPALSSNPKAIELFQDTLTHMIELQSALEKKLKSSPDLYERFKPFLKQYRPKISSNVWGSMECLAPRAYEDIIYALSRDDLEIKMESPVYRYNHLIRLYFRNIRQSYTKESFEERLKKMVFKNQSLAGHFLEGEKPKLTSNMIFNLILDFTECLLHKDRHLEYAKELLALLPVRVTDMLVAQYNSLIAPEKIEKAGLPVVLYAPHMQTIIKEFRNDIIATKGQIDLTMLLTALPLPEVTSEPTDKRARTSE